MDPKTPDVIGRYQILRPLGRGGMGTLYLAQDPVIDRLVAIKVLRADLHDSDLRERFAREARSAGRLKHHNIVTIFDVGEYDSQPFIAMEYVSGETLAALIKREEPLPLVYRLRLMEELCGALYYAHRAGVIHRDVKPANLMVDEAGALKVLDFGIARLGASDMTQSGIVMGTFNYMAPEQLEAKTIDARADMFAAGAVFYELLSYRRAFPGDQEAGILNKILNAAPEPLGAVVANLDPALIGIVDRCLAKRADDRYRDLSQVARQIALLRSMLPDVPLTTSPTSTGGRVGPAETPKAAAGPARTPRSGTDREALFRRRAEEIERHLGEAREAFARGEFEAAWQACQQAQLLDPEHQGAEDLAQRVRAGLEEQQLRDWLREARAELSHGAITAASLLVERVQTLSVSSPELDQVRQAIEHARREQGTAKERARRIERALSRAQEEFGSGHLESAAEAVNDALAADPANTRAIALQRQIREARHQAAERARAATTVENARRMFATGAHSAALEMLRTFAPAQPVITETLEELAWEAEEIARSRTVVKPVPVGAKYQPPPVVASRSYSLRAFVTYSAFAVVALAVVVSVPILKRYNGANRLAQDSNAAAPIQSAPAPAVVAPPTSPAVSVPTELPTPPQQEPIPSAPSSTGPARGLAGRVATPPRSSAQEVSPNPPPPIPPASSPAPARPLAGSPVVFSYTGNVQTWVVPVGITLVDVDARGGQGGSTQLNAGGLGGRIQTTIPVTSGQTLSIYVGGAGGAGTGGFNGGAAGGAAGHTQTEPGGGGGGASDVRVGGTALSNRVVVAGGGGGGGGSCSPAGGGGSGGSKTGTPGGPCYVHGTVSGGGGSQSAGGNGGTTTFDAPKGSAGSVGSGGTGGAGPPGQDGGGGGGGGYYGGGGGAGGNGGGGGGSSYSSGPNVVHTSSAQSGNGQIILTPKG